MKEILVLGEKNKSLTDYLHEIKVLRGIIPICSFCKKIRDEKGRCNKLEKYIVERSEAEFSLSICDECMAKHYPKDV